MEDGLEIDRIMLQIVVQERKGSRKIGEHSYQGMIFADPKAGILPYGEGLEKLLQEAIAAVRQKLAEVDHNGR